MPQGTATTTRPLLGERVGTYIITRELARGAMGVVYEAMHETIGYRAAIKVLSAGLSQDPQHQEFVGRFVDEARAVNVVQNPGIVKIFDIGALRDGTVYILMEFLEGQSLWARGRSFPGRRFPLPDALRITRQIASALAPAHDKRIIHRDLKPENVILVSDPEAPGLERTKVVDFGLARFLDSPQRRTAMGMVMGTAVYMAPEQCEGSEHMDGKLDVYALGIMLYEMLAGDPPFDGEPSPVMIAHIRQKPPPLGERARVPEAVQTLCHQMLAKAAADRPTMAEVASRLRDLIRQAEAEAPSSPHANASAAPMPAGQARSSERRTERVSAASPGSAWLARSIRLPLWAVVLLGLVLFSASVGCLLSLGPR